MTNLSLMSIVQLSHDLSTLSLGPVHRACRAASYGKVTVGKMPDSGPAEKLECFGGLSNKRENFQKRCPYPLCYLLCFFQSLLLFSVLMQKALSDTGKRSLLKKEVKDGCLKNLSLHM